VGKNTVGFETTSIAQIESIYILAMYDARAHIASPEFSRQKRRSFGNDEVEILLPVKPGR